MVKLLNNFHHFFGILFLFCSACAMKNPHINFLRTSETDTTKLSSPIPQETEFIKQLPDLLTEELAIEFALSRQCMKSL